MHVLATRHLARDVCGLRRSLLLLLPLAISAVFVGPVFADDPSEDVEDVDLDEIADLSLEALSDLDVIVTSVSKKEQKLSEAASAIYVISQEDIRRSGATSTPELLRMVPGLFVANIAANSWVVSSRGFGSEYSNKLLVLMDGRSLYNSVFSGVYWQIQDYPLEDIERIEVIRGPGATLWGANAVNGVINIITKHSEDTQGGSSTTFMGTTERYESFRYGGSNGENLFYRIYGKYRDVDEFKDQFDDNTDDDWLQRQLGFRVDWQASAEDSLMVQGSVSDTDSHRLIDYPDLSLAPTYRQPIEVTGSENLATSILLRWSRHHADDSGIEFQAYYDHNDQLEERLNDLTYDTFDLDFQHRLPPFERSEIIWGLGYRFYADDFVDGLYYSFDPPQDEFHLFSAFVQATHALSEDLLEFTLGSKFEHNDFSGFEYQPSARLLFTPDSRYSAWAAVSRAVRTPSRADHTLIVDVLAVEPNPLDPDPLNPFWPPLSVSGRGDGKLDSEELLAFEIGQRFQLGNRSSIDLTVFYNDYDSLRTYDRDPLSERLAPGPPIHIQIPLLARNSMKGEAYGTELAAQFYLTDRWRIASSYSFLDIQLHLDATSGDFLNEPQEGQSPEHQFKLQSYVDLPADLEFDTTLYAISNLPAWDIPSYTRLDLRLGWKPSDTLEASVGAYNVLDDRHPEAHTEFIGIATEIEHGIYAKLALRF